jgi:hypothetical protein
VICALLQRKRLIGDLKAVLLLPTSYASQAGEGTWHAITSSWLGSTPWQGIHAYDISLQSRILCSRNYLVVGTSLRWEEGWLHYGRKRPFTWRKATECSVMLCKFFYNSVEFVHIFTKASCCKEDYTTGKNRGRWRLCYGLIG